ncbi:MAG: hypothetical protein Q7R33_03470, partial [Nitrosarchaeum sp.]|nr:hypothetical protein [Nitrosarchaeum sp.]
VVVAHSIVSQNFAIANINSINSLGNDLFIIDWSASDADNDSLFFSASYSHNGVDFKPVALSRLYNGETFDFNAQEIYSGSNQGFLRFIVSDGVNTTTADTETFVVSNKSPFAVILSPDINSSFDFNQTISFEALASDKEEGYLQDEAVVWNSNINGFLGNGEILDSNTLSIGLHTITLTITDSEGLQSSDSIKINVCGRIENGLRYCVVKHAPEDYA